MDFEVVHPNTVLSDSSHGFTDNNVTCYKYAIYASVTIGVLTD